MSTSISAAESSERRRSSIFGIGSPRSPGNSSAIRGHPCPPPPGHPCPPPPGHLCPRVLRFLGSRLQSQESPATGGDGSLGSRAAGVDGAVESRVTEAAEFSGQVKSQRSGWVAAAGGIGAGQCGRVGRFSSAARSVLLACGTARRGGHQGESPLQIKLGTRRRLLPFWLSVAACGPSNELIQWLSALLSVRLSL